MRRAPITRALLVVLLVAGVAGCKDGDKLESTFFDITPSFVSQGPAGPSQRFVTVEQAMVDDDRIVLDVVLHEIDEPVSGIAATLRYPPQFSKFIRCLDGDLFPPGMCHAEEVGAQPGTLLIGRSVTMPDQVRPVVGARVIVRLEFLVFGKGMGPLFFEGQNLSEGDTSAVLDGMGDPIFVDWFTGTLMGE